jgi:hypothetical protein
LGYFILFVIILIFKFSIKSKNWLFPILIIFDLGLTFAGTLVFAKYYVGWQEIPDSLSRMVMFMPLLIVFSCAELLSELTTKYNHG